jgi:hypothetical protein
MDPCSPSQPVAILELSSQVIENLEIGDVRKNTCQTKWEHHLKRNVFTHVLVSSPIKSIIEQSLYHKQIKEARNETITFAHLLFSNNKQKQTIHTFGCKIDAVFQNIDGSLRSSINMGQPLFAATKDFFKT